MNKEYELLKKLYFERRGGTKEELEACKIIQNELKELGYDSYLEAFNVTHTTNSKAHMEVTSPYTKTYEVTAYEAKENLELLEGELYYFEQDTPVCRKGVKGKIAIVNGYLNMRTLNALTESGAIGAITYSGDIDREYNDLDVREYRDMIKAFGNIPAIHMRVTDAMELISKGAKTLKFSYSQEVNTVQSHNVICDIKGESDDTIVVTAHYDSVPFSKGAYDNATGSVCLYKVAEVLKDIPLKHNVKLIWCGSEERGLIGSRAFVAAHKEELKNIKLCVNIDMIGSVMGQRNAVCASEMSLVHYTDYYAKINGYPLNVKQGPYSSDSTSFAEAGVPGMTFARITHQGTGSIHSYRDVLEIMSERLLNEDCTFIAEYVKHMANSYIIPVEQTIPDNVKKDIEKMFARDLLKEKQQ